MAGLFYYLPGGNRNAGIEEARAAGLGYAFEKTCRARGCTRGPDGGQGVVIADERCIGGEGLGYFPEKQTWRKVPGTGGKDEGGRMKDESEGRQAWVGYFTESPPGPGELERQETLPGALVRLGDDNEWLIPIARGVIESEDILVGTLALPTVTGIDDGGRWCSAGVCPKYATLWQAACRWWDMKTAAIQAVAGAPKSPADQDKTSLTFELDDIRDIALTALAANYRVGKVEVAVLGLFNDLVEIRISDVLVDWDSWIKLMQKKTASGAVGGSSTDAGPQGDTKDTVPQ